MHLRVRTCNYCHGSFGVTVYLCHILLGVANGVWEHGWTIPPVNCFCQFLSCVRSTRISVYGFVKCMADK